MHQAKNKKIKGIRKPKNAYVKLMAKHKKKMKTFTGS